MLVGAPTALAAEIRQGDSVVVGPGDVINDDLYAFGSTVTIMGTVNGDVFAAGNAVTVSGMVSGDVFAAGNTVSLTGDIRNSLRAAGATVTVSGPIGEDALVAASSVDLAPGARVGRDLLIGVGTATVNAPVARNVLAGAGTLSIGAPVGGDLRADVDTLRVSSGGSVNGAVAYTSAREAEIAPGASIGGALQRTEPQARRDPSPVANMPGAAVIDWLRGLVGPAAVGLLVVLLFPAFTRRMIATGTHAPWSSLGLGSAVVIGVPMLTIVVVVLGIILGGWWLALLVLALYGFAVAVGYALAAVFVAQGTLRLFRQPEHRYVWNVLEGVALLGVLTLLPMAGWLVGLIAVAFGLGAVSLSAVDAYRRLPIRARAQAAPQSAVEPALATA
jgi:cytoskeletal protein CcmA (bactofilin family)